MLTSPEDRAPTAARLPLLAHHALAAGDIDRGLRFVVAAARSALDGHAPEEALRLLEEARTIAISPRDRAGLLCLGDRRGASARTLKQRRGQCEWMPWLMRST